ncbi:MAG: nucleotidyltransferase domain-containing protein [Bacilli bacterium]|nr:nucleotidyltransferase domain-containing protein [Bacilli bacterium]
MSFNQQEYIGKYNKDKYKSILLRLRKDEAEILAKLSSVSSVNAYILSLIKEDISSSVLSIKAIKNAILPILNRHGIEEVYLFGSYARGEANSNSDVDIYCSSGDIETFIEQGKLEDELQNALGKDVDIVFVGSKMDDYFKEQLEADKIRLC